MNWENIIRKKYDSDTLYMSFDNLEELVNVMLKNNDMNAKSLNIIYQNVKSGKIKKDKEKDYLNSFRRYVTRKHGLRKQWDELVSEGKF